MDTPTVADLWGQELFSEAGEHLGRIEAVGMTRDRIPHRVGVRSAAGGSRLRFFPLTQVQRVDGRLVLGGAPPP
ncbi:MAG TPA: hypothetical protein VKY90_17685 [Candidatus Dormibacteraeota bacterium]|nr:hypothetical protein [Candidatus Dormibacteraeota bacterium]